MNKAIGAVLLERHHDYSTLSSSFESVGLNSGNQVFREALLRNLLLEKMTYEEYCAAQEKYVGLPVVVTDLIWINESSNFDYLYDRVRRFKDIAFVPISAGLQAKSFDTDFKLNSSVQRTLSAIQERAVIGVRGEYTAEILSRHGIKNIEIIGCPSLYYAGTTSFKIEKKVDKINRVSVNFRTFYGLLSREEKHFLTYCANRGYDFVEQTQYEFTPDNAVDRNYYNYVSKWINSKKKIYFDVDEWKKYLTAFQFSMGFRFHGNVVALWDRIPALFFAIDSRTEEMLRYFELPFIRPCDFDDTKPIEYYYELADYKAFNKGYEQKYLKYREFLTKNNIPQNGK
ncbi:MAG: polysaccharide pyruvyl transferase family protein [Firmicutes bacterium]|nr:polysaccharide pyruvyl transferase family protein [Bacillota bacterium]